MTTILVRVVKIIAWLFVVGLTSAYVAHWLGLLVLVGVPVLALWRHGSRGRAGGPVKTAARPRQVSTGGTGGTSAGAQCRMCTGHGEPCPTCGGGMGMSARGSGCFNCRGRGRVACRFCHRGP